MCFLSRYGKRNHLDFICVNPFYVMSCLENCLENKMGLNEPERVLKTPYYMGFLQIEMANLGKTCQSRSGKFALNK